MKTKKTIVCGFLAVVFALTFVFTGCSLLMSAININKDAWDASLGTSGNTNEQSGRTASGTSNSGSPTQTTQFKFTLINNGTAYSVSKGTEINGAVVIPTTYNGKPVMEIGSASDDPNNGAFYGCTSLTSLTIPSSVTSIGNGAFWKCDSLTSITVDANNPNYSSVDGVLFNKNRTVLIQYPIGKQERSYTIPSSVTSIGGVAFSGCTSLTSVTIPNSVTSIGGGAFYSCTSFTSVIIPNSVTSIEGYTFFGCTKLTSVTIPNSVTSIGEAAFYDCTSLTRITIPSSVTVIAEATFYGCTSLTSVTIPNSVTSIGQVAFCDCTSLTSITIPSSVTYIGSGAFAGCRSLTSVTIPSSVTEIGATAFANTSITSVTMSRRTRRIEGRTEREGRIIYIEPVFPPQARITYSD